MRRPGTPVRTVRSIQMFNKSGSVTETANTALRGPSMGVWGRDHNSGHEFDASYWFFRYKLDGTFSSFAKILDTITLGPDGKEFHRQGLWRTSTRTVFLFLSAASRIPRSCWQLQNMKTDLSRADRKLVVG